MARMHVAGRAIRRALTLLLLPAVASAHTALKRSDPAKDSTIATAPTRVTLWFTATPELAFSRITLTGPDGAGVPLGPVRADSGDALVADITRPLRAGAYVVRWQTASADGHPIQGEFTFILLVDDARAGEALAPGMTQAAPAGQAPTDSAGATHTARTGNRAVRWIEFAALLVILGALGFRGIVVPALASRGVSVADASDRARRLGQSAVGLYALAAIARLYSQSAALAGREDALAPTALRVLVTGTSWGIGWAAGAVGALLVYVGWKLSRRHGYGLVVVIVGALGLVTAPAMTGHAATIRPVAVSVTLDALHVAAAGMWIGGLLIVLFAGIPAMLQLGEDARDRAVASLVNSFHPLALFCAPLVALTGVAGAWLRLGGPGPLLTSDYGQALLWKLVLFALVLAAGAYNSARARRRLGTPLATRHIRMTGAAELFLAALVVAATAVLVATPLPADLQ